jgi:hypothetical protein
MRARRRAVVSALAGLAAMRTAGALPAQPAIELIRLGPAEVADERRIDLSEATVDLAGRAWGFSHGDRIAVFLKPLGRGAWAEAAADEAPAGGLFEISGLRFPEAGSYELIACLQSAGDLPAGRARAAAACGDRALAASRRLLVRVDARPLRLESASPVLAVLTVDGIQLDPDRPTPVPATGETVLRASGLAAGTRVYLALLAAGSDRAYLRGPARPGPEPDLYALPGVPFEVPGDPRGAHLQLMAVATPELLASGPTTLSSLERRAGALSPAVAVVVDEKWEASNSARVPRIAVTRIGDQVLPTTPAAAAKALPPPLEIEPGDAVEVGESERVPEGARLWILTRPRGSGLWLVQGPAVMSGGPTPEDPGAGPPRVTWHWSSLRFEALDAGPRERRQSARQEFELMAALSSSTLPEGWIDSAALAGSFVLTVSQIVRVSAAPDPPFSDLRIAISRVGDQDADSEAETLVGEAEPIEIASGQRLPAPWRLYLARHKVGSSLWTLIEAIPQGRSHVVPAVSFINPHAQEGARYQLLAVVTRGLLPAEQLEYSDLVHAALASSAVVNVRYQPGGTPHSAARLLQRTKPMLDIPGSRILWTLLLLVSALLLLSLLEWWLGIVAHLAGSAARRLEDGRRSLRGRLAPPVTIDPAKFLLGLVVAAAVGFGLVRYVPLYAKAVSEVTGFTMPESARLTFWVVMLTALLGTFLELSVEHSTETGKPEGRAAAILLGFFLLLLILFEGAFYYTFLSRTATGLVAILGGVAFSMFAFIEAMAFFFITRLSLAPAGTLLGGLFLLPLLLAEITLQIAAGFFASLPKWKPQEIPRRQTSDPEVQS